MLLTLVIFFLLAAWIPSGKKGGGFRSPFVNLDTYILERGKCLGNLQPPFIE